MDVNQILKCAVFSISLSVLVACGSVNQQNVNNVAPVEKASCVPTAVQGRYIVNWKDGRRTIAHYKNRDELIEKFVKPNLEKLKLVERDQYIQISPPKQLATTDIAATNYHWGADEIEASYAWNMNVTGAGVNVAVVDSGADISHPQLAGQFLKNPGEVPNNGIDDDGNGCIDDVYGCDYSVRGGSNGKFGTGNMVDPNGHGTHVSGIIAAKNIDGTVMGVAQNAKIIPVRFMDANGSGMISDAIDAIDYAAQRGAQVINASWGGSFCSTTLQTHINDLANKGVLFVSAAGNESLDIDAYPTYPAAFNAPSQITVGASTQMHYTAFFSNIGLTKVHVAAPGTTIWSTYKGSVAAKDGTSMASPFVAGVAALLKSYRPTATYDKIRTAILNGVTPGYYPVSTRGEVNVRRAMQALDTL